MKQRTTLSRFKNMPGVAWLVIGVCVTALVLPSAAYATGVLKQVGIEGTSTNRADVTSAGQVLSTEAKPSNLFGGSSFDYGLVTMTNPSTTQQGVFAAPSTSAVVMDALSLDVYQWTGGVTPDNQTQYDLFIGNSSCAQISYWFFPVNPTGFGTTTIPLTPGVAIPAGDSLCVVGVADAGSYSVDITATGSLVPPGGVTNGPLHAAPKLAG